MSTGPLRLGRYELIRLIGEGGMGRVWEADLCGPAGFRKRVALKVLKAGGGGLAHEARLGGLLRHPHLVEVYELGVAEVDGAETWFCAMELVPGRVVDYVPMPLSAAVDVVRQAALGLAHAAEQIGLVHLDLKPANLLVHNGVVKVADLGISRAFGAGRGQKVEGTPAYMSPEQRAGRGVDARSDVFSLGVLLIALVAGKPSRDPKAIPELEPILELCLAEDPNARFRTAAELADALVAVALPGPVLDDRLASTFSSSRTGATSTAGSDTYSFATEVVERRTNLGPEPDAFVGRAALVDDVLERVREPGLWTLKAMGGLGKTRLASRVARRWHASVGLPAWFCDLSECWSEADVLAVMARVLEVPGGREDLDAMARRVGAAMAAGPMLVVLDNLEQVPFVAQFVTRWMAQAPELRVIATSREPLRIRGESVIEVEPLTEDEAVELLAARAGARGATVPIDADLRELAMRLDGIPLALELASGRLSMLSARQVLDRLDQRLKLLSRGSKGAPARQATLRGALDWSWELLDEYERLAFVQLAVFAGGFTLEAAEEVLDLPDDAPWAMDLVQSLHERSLLRSSGNPPRFGMFESLRAYAQSRGDSGVQAAHAAHYAALGEAEALMALNGHGGPERVGVLLREADNLKSAAQWAVSADDPTAVPLIQAIVTLLLRHGPVSETVAWVERGLEISGLSEAQRHELRVLLGSAMRRSGHIGAAEALAAGVEAARASGSAKLLTGALLSLANFEWEQGRLESCEAHADEATVVSKLSGDERDRALAASIHGLLALQRGQLDAAKTAYELSLTIAKRVGDVRHEGLAYVNLGIVADDKGDVAEAERLYRKGRRAFREIGDRAAEANLLGNLAAMLGDHGRASEADRVNTLALELVERVGDQRTMGVILGSIGCSARDQGAFKRARECFDRALACHQQVHNRRYEGIVRCYLGEIALDEDRYEEAAEQLEIALEIHLEVQDPSFQAMDRVCRARLGLRVGAPKPALRDAEMAVELARGKHAQTLASALSVRGEARALLGIPGALADVDEALALLEQAQFVREVASGLLTRARVALAFEQSTTEWMGKARTVIDGLGLPSEGPLGRDFARTKALIRDAKTG